MISLLSSTSALRWLQRLWFVTAWAGFGPDWSEHGCELTKKTGHRIKYLKVDADTGEEVSSDEIIKGYKVDTDM